MIALLLGSVSSSALLDSILVDTSRIAKFSMVKFSDELQASRLAKFSLMQFSDEIQAARIAKFILIESGYGNVQTRPAPTSHRYWRVVVDQCTSNGAYVEEIEFRDSAGGADLTNSTMTVLSDFSYNPPSNAFDGDPATATFGAEGEYIGIDLGVGNPAAVEEVAWTHQGTQQRMFTGRVEYSDDGTNWSRSWGMAKTTFVGGSGTDVWRYDDAADGLIFDLRATADPPTEQVSGVACTKTNSPTVNTTTQYMEFSSGNVLNLAMPTGVNQLCSGVANWTVEFHVDSATSLQQVFNASAEPTIFNLSDKFGWYNRGVDAARSTDSLLDGTETHFALVMQDGVMTLYANGVAKPLDINLDHTWHIEGTTVIGGETSTTRIFATGKFGRMVCWNFARYTGTFLPPSVTDVPFYEIP